MTRLSLRVLAILQALLALKLVVFERLQTGIVEQLRRAGSRSTAIVAELARLYAISRALSWSIMALSVAAIVAFAVGSKRRLARIGAASFTLHALMAVGLTVFGAKAAPSTATELAWWAQSVAGNVGLALCLCAVARRSAAIAFIAVAVGKGFASFAIGRIKDLPRGASFAFAAMAAVVLLIFAVVAFTSASRVGAVEPPSGATNEADTRAADSLRLVAWSTLVRIGGGVVGAIAAIASMRDADVSGGSMVALFGVVGAIAAVTMVLGLIGYARTEAGAAYRIGVGFVVALIAIATALDLSSLSAASELFDAVAQAKKATSFWGMPSLRRIEELQEVLRWTSRAQIVIGTLAIMTLATVLRGAAERRGASEEVERGGRVRVLAPITAVIALLGSFLLEGPKAAELALLVSVVGLFFAFASIVSFVRLLFGVAAAIERPFTAPTEAA